MTKTGSLNILVFSPTPSHPQNAGNRVRIFNLSHYLQSQGYSIHFVYYVQEGLSKEQETAMSEQWDSLSIIKKTKSYKRPDIGYHLADDWYQEDIGPMIKKRCRELDIDVVLTNYIFQSRLLESVPKGIVKVIDTHDRFSDRHLMLQEKGVRPDFFYTVAEEEAKALDRADLVLAIQDEERAFFESITKAKVRLLGHIEQEDILRPDHRVVKNIGFIGSSNSINKRSIEDFISLFLASDEVRKNKVRLVIAGSICDKLTIEDETIVYLGHVWSLRTFYQNVDLVINPLILGTGLKIKSIEALSFGMPIVSTEVGFEGIDSDSDLHKVKDNNELIESIGRLIARPESLDILSKKSVSVFRDYTKGLYEQVDTLISEMTALSLKGRKDKGHMIDNKSLFIDIGDIEDIASVLQREEFLNTGCYLVTSRHIKTSDSYIDSFFTDSLSSGLPWEIDGMRFKDVYLITNKERIDDLGLMQSIYSTEFGSLYTIDTQHDVQAYMPYKDDDAKTLMVFPGAFVPIRMGSHQRAFNMIHQLNSRDLFTDLLMPLDREAESALSRRLGSLASKVFFYENKKIPYPYLFRLRRKMEMFIKKILGRPHRLADLFSERNYRRASLDGKRMLADLLKTHDYDTVIIHYAWMMPIKELVKERPDIRWICDTHDVQFIRNKTVDEHDRRYIVNWQREKALEIDNLRLADKVLTISESDLEVFKAYLPGAAMMLCHPGFEHLYMPVKRRFRRDTFTFGFIGGKMMANVLALSHVLEHWWPKIRERFSDARLLIAGSICFEESIVKQLFLEDGVERVGFVNNLKGYYSQIDVLLSPVFVKGGLNFKNIEALVAGKHVITNKLGSLSLEQFDALGSFASIEDILRFLEMCSEDVERDLQIRLHHQEKALEYFASDAAYAELMDYLHEA